MPTAAPQPTAARPAARKPLTQATYDSWRTIGGSLLSPDGQHVAWTQTPVVGDGEVHVARVAGGTPHVVVQRGWTGRPQLQPNADSGWTAPPVQWSADSRWVAFLAYAPQAKFDEARRLKRRPADMPKAELVLQDATTPGAAAVRVPNVKSFRLPRERGTWLAYHLEADSAARAAAPAARDTSARPVPAAGAPTTAAATPGGTPRPVSDSAGGATPPRDPGRRSCCATSPPAARRASPT